MWVPLAVTRMFISIKRDDVQRVMEQAADPNISSRDAQGVAEKVGFGTDYTYKFSFLSIMYQSQKWKGGTFIFVPPFTSATRVLE